jgi:hypothetical protein
LAFYTAENHQKSVKQVETGIYGSSTVDDTKSLLNFNVDGILNEPDIKFSPDQSFFYQTPVSLSPVLNGGVHYEPKGPFTCSWDGFPQLANYTSCDPTPFYNNLAHGSYLIKLKICDVKGACGDTAKRLIVSRPPTDPLVSINITGNISNGHYEVLLNAGGSRDPDNDKITYEWKGKNNDDLYPSGTNTVQVRAIDEFGAYSNWVTKTFDTKDPLKAMFDDWVNYIKTDGLSGQWKYNDTTKQLYSTQNVGWTGYWNPADVSYHDYQLSYDVAVFDGDDDAVGMTFRMQDLNNMYMLSIDNRSVNAGVGGYHSGLYRIKNGTKTLVYDLMPLAWQKNVWDSYKIVAVGPNIKIYRNGSLIADYTDPSPILNGGYGPFTISQANAYFRNVLFKSLD